MSKQRVIDTRFWIDDYISNLDPVEKLLFLYFLTNQYTDICGIYEVPLKSIALDTGIDKEMVEKILKRFHRDKKIFYEGGWVCVVNFTKYQNTNNPKIQKGIEVGLNKAPKSLMDRLSIANQDLSHLNSNSNSNSNSNTLRLPRKNKLMRYDYSNSWNEEKKACDPQKAVIDNIISKFDELYFKEIGKKMYPENVPLTRKSVKNALKTYKEDEILELMPSFFSNEFYRTTGWAIWTMMSNKVLNSLKNG